MMNFEMPILSLVLPEIFLLTMTCIVLIVDLFLSERTRVFTYVLSQITLILTAAIIYGSFSTDAVSTFNGMYVRDSLGDVLKIVVLLVTFGAFLYAKDYLRERNLFKGEYYVLGLFAVLGMMVIISAHNLLTIYMGLELLSLSLYAMVAFQRDSSNASEAAMKYFILGAMASGMMLYGMSMLYGATTSLDIPEIAKAIGNYQGDNLLLLVGCIFIIVGLAFKLGAVPFHMWVPDVYHGAPTSVTLFIGSAPKLAAFAMFIRLLAEGMPGLHSDWMHILTVLAVLSMGLGNIIAIAQTNIKRMLAYSTISHVGFILLGIISGTSQGYSAAMYYTIIYAIMALGAFGMIILLSRRGFEADNLEDFKGLNERSPWFALIMLLLLFSMAGVPPTVGFYAKLFVIKAVIDINMVWLAIVAVLFSVIGAYYYLRVIKLMYFDRPDAEITIGKGTDLRVMLSVNGLAMLVLGLMPGSLLALCSTVL